MPKFVVLTDAETAVGFRLAGVEVRESVAAEAVHTLEEMIASDEYALVAVDEGLVADPVKATEGSMRGRDLPVLLSVPSLGAAFDEGNDAVTYMKELVRSAIGFDIKLE
ncbi:MAG TPA: V-type ATP synthase subunit F [Trueperaceae bacterium]|nr:V-type ATP synthase subunit F [Trueperaceae bacterium]